MKKLEPNDPDTKSADLLGDNIARLRLLFPELITEGADGIAVDVDVLKMLVGDKRITDTDEKFGLNWHGKRRARQMALLPSTGTLRPCPEDSVDWDTTKNLMIEGDNLEVIKLLQKSYAGKVKLIYIDPPYNTGKDFVYPDDFQDNIKNYLELTGQVKCGRKISSNTETNGRFHTNWLNMMFPRLKLARNLLGLDGIILISIDDGEVARLRHVMDEIFGVENFLSTFVWKKKAGGGDDSGHVAAEHEYILCYARDEAHCELASILHESPSMTAKYNRDEGGRRYYLERLDKTSLTYNASMNYELECPDGTIVKPPQPNPAHPTTIWRWGRETVKKRRDELVFERDKKSGDWRVYTKTWEPSDGVTPRTLLIEKDHGRNRDGTTELAVLLGPKVFTNPKPVKLLRHLLSIGAKGEDDIVMDFFAGSGTTGHAVYEMNAQLGGQRRFILIQLPEKLKEDLIPERPGIAFCQSIGRSADVVEITKERLRRAAKKIKDENPMFAGDLGFRVFKLASSNIKEWEPDRENLTKTLLDSVDHIKGDRTESDILHELLLKLGLDLCVPIEKKIIARKEVHAIGSGVLLACLAKKIIGDDVEALAQGIIDWHKVLSPAGDVTCVFRDSAFTDDVAKTNLAVILQQHGLANVRSL